MAKDLYPTAEPRFVGPAEDVEALRQCHRDWWAANNTQERATIVRRASRNFAPETLMFNLNGHTYYGLDEMREVWQHYSEMLDLEVVRPCCSARRPSRAGTMAREIPCGRSGTSTARRPRPRMGRVLASATPGSTVAARAVEPLRRPSSCRSRGRS
jgi:hypothetical protein